MFTPNYFSDILAGESTAWNLTPPTPLVSIVIPTYMEQEYIVRTLESLSEQTVWDKTEVVLADYDPDGTKQTINAVKSFIADNPRFRRVRFVDVGKKGIGYARMIGTASTRAPFITTFDADARFAKPNAMELLLEPLFTAQANATCTGNIMDGDVKNDWASTSYVLRNELVKWVPMVYEPGFTFPRVIYDMAGGWRDVKMYEAPLLAFDMITNGCGRLKYVQDAYVIVSGRRLGNAFDLDYDYAYRNGKRVEIK